MGQTLLRSKDRFSIFILLSLVVLFLSGIKAPAWPADAGGFLVVEGWKQRGQIQIYTPDTLFDYIDGAADLYLKYDFENLRVAEYRNIENGAVILEIYRHRTPNDSFGIYSQERPARGKYLPIGGQGYTDEGSVNFVIGKFYVKINTPNLEGKREDVLLRFARETAQNLGEKGALPAILSSFPQEGKKENSEKFIAKNFLGYSFFHAAFTADYDVSGKLFKLFIMEGRQAPECQAMLQKYFQQMIKNPPQKVIEGSFLLTDPYHGEVSLLWKGKYVAGITELRDPLLRSKYLSLLEAHLAEKN